MQKLGLLLCLNILWLIGCSTQPDISAVGSQVSSQYQSPQSYSEHRAQQQFLATSNGRLAYTDHGQGPALVLLHGVPTSSWLYRKIIPELQQDFRVISVDLLGYGSSDKPKGATAQTRPAAQASYVAELLKHLDIPQYSLLMHDMGGLVAWEMLRSQPQQVKNLIVLNTIVREQGFNHPNLPPDAITKAVTQAYANNLTSTAILETSLQSLGLDKDHGLSEMECFGYVKPMTEGGDEALYSFFTLLKEDSFYQQLEQNKAIFEDFSGETLILWGAEDDILTTAQIPFLQQHLRVPQANIHIYPEHKHFLMEEIPQEVVRQIQRFLGAN